MISKEALEELFNLLCEREHTNSEHNFWLKLFNDIEKDLEVLEIIKNHIVTKNFEYGSDFDSYNKIGFTAEIIQLKDFIDKLNELHCTTFKVDNGFEKVKEWLENE